MTNIPEAESYGQLDRDFDNEIYATFNLPEAEDKETEKEDLNARLNELERRNKDLEARQKTIPTTFEQTYAPPVQSNQVIFLLKTSKNNLSKHLSLTPEQR